MWVVRYICGLMNVYVCRWIYMWVNGNTYGRIIYMWVDGCLCG